MHIHSYHWSETNPPLHNLKQLSRTIEEQSRKRRDPISNAAETISEIYQQATVLRLFKLFEPKAFAVYRKRDAVLGRRLYTFNFKRKASQRELEKAAERLNRWEPLPRMPAPVVSYIERWLSRHMIDSYNPNTDTVTEFIGYGFNGISYEEVEFAACSNEMSLLMCTLPWDSSEFGGDEMLFQHILPSIDLDDTDLVSPKLAFMPEFDRTFANWKKAIDTVTGSGFPKWLPESDFSLVWLLFHRATDNPFLDNDPGEGFEGEELDWCYLELSAVMDCFKDSFRYLEALSRILRQLRPPAHARQFLRFWGKLERHSILDSTTTLSGLDQERAGVIGNNATTHAVMDIEELE